VRNLKLGARGLALLCVAALVGCGVRSTSPAAGTFVPRNPGTLTVVTSEVPTIGFFEGTTQHPTGGFEYELARALADRFALRSVRIVIVPFAQVVAGNLGGADMALDLITPTSKREKHLDFSTPYLTSPPTAVVRQGTSIPDLKTAQGLRWGAVRSTTFVDAIEDLVHPGPPTQLFEGNNPLLTALRGGEIDAAMLDLPFAVVAAHQSHGTLKVAAQLPAPESIAAALPKGSANREAVDSAIRAFTADGTVHRLLERWVGSAVANAETAIPLLHTTRPE
jgi:ABC-type amino acid transport substrate-binding protein